MVTECITIATHAQSIKMATYGVAVGARLTPERLLRPHWVELTDRVWADNVTDKLYEREIRGGHFLKFCRQEVASFWRQRIVCRQNNPDVIITCISDYVM